MSRANKCYSWIFVPIYCKQLLDWQTSAFFVVGLESKRQNLCRKSLDSCFSDSQKVPPAGMSMVIIFNVYSQLSFQMP